MTDERDSGRRVDWGGVDGGAFGDGGSAGDVGERITVEEGVGVEEAVGVCMGCGGDGDRDREGGRLRLSLEGGEVGLVVVIWMLLLLVMVICEPCGMVIVVPLIVIVCIGGVGGGGGGGSELDPARAFAMVGGVSGGGVGGVGGSAEGACECGGGGSAEGACECGGGGSAEGACGAVGGDRVECECGGGWDPMGCGGVVVCVWCLWWKLALLCLPRWKLVVVVSPKRLTSAAMISPRSFSLTRCGNCTPWTLTKPVFGFPVLLQRAAFSSGMISKLLIAPLLGNGREATNDTMSAYCGCE